ncbi:hypothetical protein KC959_04090, partial [Candidatus Saccharibacteria bacterium]|nr:hypothetical protein [Candidatus Saccharibacteria bacterium]
MKILVIRNAWRHQDFGGAEELALSLVSTLNALGVETKLLSGGEALLNRAESLSVPYIKGPFSKRQILTKHRAIFLPKYLFDLCRARTRYIKMFKSEAPSVIHCTGQ